MNAIDKCKIVNHTVDGKPTGGSVHGTGLIIEWQDGPLGRGKDRLLPNGAFVETVISACIQRLEYYQQSEFRCNENQFAIFNLEEALRHLEERTADRESRQVEGTHNA